MELYFLKRACASIVVQAHNFIDGPKHRRRRGGGREAAAPLAEQKFAKFGQFS